MAFSLFPQKFSEDFFARIFSKSEKGYKSFEILICFFCLLNRRQQQKQQQQQDEQNMIKKKPVKKETHTHTKKNILHVSYKTRNVYGFWQISLQL